MPLDTRKIVDSFVIQYENDELQQSMGRGVGEESIKCSIEHKAFLLSCDLAPCHSPPPRQQVVYLSQSSYDVDRAYILKVHKIEFFFCFDFEIYYFFVIYVKILRFHKQIFLIRPLLGEVRFFRRVLRLCGMKNFF